MLPRVLAHFGLQAVPRRQKRRDPFPPTLVLETVSRRPTELAAETVQTVLEQPVPRSARAVDRPEVVVVVVTRGGLVYNRLCLESVLADTAAPPLRLVVVDNASSDGTRDYLKKLARRDRRVRLLMNESNGGFAAGVNQGLTAEQAPALVVLNNDTVVPPGAIGRLVEHLDDATLGLVGPVSNNAATEAEIDPPYRTYGEFVREAGRLAQAHAGRVADLPMLTMFCVAMRRDVYDSVGPLDERYEVGLFEDDDYSLRVRSAGYRVACAEDVLVHHFGEASFGKLVPTGEYAAIFEENRRRFEAKWERPWEPHRRRESETYAELKERIRGIVSSAVPPGARILVVSKGDDDLLDLDGRPAAHFPQLEGGVYAGHYPANGEEVIAQLEQLSVNGAGGEQFLLFPMTSLWWLEHYAELGHYLETRCARRVFDEETCAIYALGESR